MFSSNTPRCNSPRPKTTNLSGSAVGSTRSATLWMASRSRRSRICRLVTNLPSRPKNGEVLTSKVMLMVGSSTVRLGSGSTVAGSHKVIAQGIRYLGFCNAGEGNDIPGAGGFHLDARQAVETQD